MQRAGLDFELEGGPGPRGAEISDGMFLTQMGIGGYEGLDTFGVTQTDQVRRPAFPPHPPLSVRQTHCTRLVFFFFITFGHCLFPLRRLPNRGACINKIAFLLFNARYETDTPPPLALPLSLFIFILIRLPPCLGFERNSRKWRRSTAARGTLISITRIISSSTLNGRP